MELFFLALLVLSMAGALAVGFPVAFALPGSAILTIGVASISGFIFTGDISSYFSQDGPIQWLTAGVTNFRGIYWEVERDTLIAVPLFVFMGIMLQRSKIAEDLLVTMAKLFGPVPGGLGISVVLVGALLAATTGILGATVVAMGLISLPAMLRNNYSKSLASGTIAAAGTLGQIIPPSIVLIILADQLSNATGQATALRWLEYKNATGKSQLPTEFGITSTSAGDMFLGALLPGIILVTLYVIYILITALVRPNMAPPIPSDEKFNLRFGIKVILALVPPLTLILAVLGSIIMGVATVNQAGAIGAIGAMIMAGYRLMEGKRRAFIPAIIALLSIAAIFVLLNQFDLNIKNIDNRKDLIGVSLAILAVIALLISVAWSAWRTIKIDDTLIGVMKETAKTTSMVFIILLGAAMLTAAFRSFGGEQLVKEFLTSLPGGFWAQFIVVMAVIFFLGFFLDFIEIAVVVVPIVAPILLSDPAANVTAVWLGVMIGVNMQTSFLTPPFGFALFYLRGVASVEVKTTDIYKGVIAFIILQLVGLGVVGVFPSLVNFLPNQSFLNSDTAPPPKNRRLQICMEEYLYEWYNENSVFLKSEIQSVKTIDISYLPEKRRNELSESFLYAEKTFDLYDNIFIAEEHVINATSRYRPIHKMARKQEKLIRKIDREIANLNDEIRRLKRADLTSKYTTKEFEEMIHNLTKEKDQAKSRIPPNWNAIRKTFISLLDNEKQARRVYRQNVDKAYEPVKKYLLLAKSANLLSQLSDDMIQLRDLTKNGSVKEIKATIKKIRIKLTKSAPGTNSISRLLTKASRALKTNNKSRQKSVKYIDDAVNLFLSEVKWRSKASLELYDNLSIYNNAIKSSIGLRLQERLPSEVANSIAICRSTHRDISLNF